MSSWPIGNAAGWSRSPGDVESWDRERCQWSKATLIACWMKIKTWSAAKGHSHTEPDGGSSILLLMDQ